MNARGQTLVLAALLALLICLAVLATVSLGQATHERIRLQHTADAAAYSMATAEARAFNLYAIVNRTHASHYVSAMLWQSLLSHLFFAEAFLTDLTGVAHTFPCLAPTGVWKAICRAVERSPGVGPTVRLLRGVTQLLTQATRAYQEGLQGGDPGQGAPDVVDTELGERIVPSLVEMNGALSALAQSVMEGTAGVVENAGEEVVRANDPTLSPKAIQHELAALSSCAFARSHAAAALGRPGEPRKDPFAALDPRARMDTNPTARAKRVMAGVANATRAACDETSGSACPRGFATARKDARWALPPALGGIRALAASVPKWGQTRLLSYGMAGADGQNFIREPEGAPNVPTGMLAQGDNLGADDLYELPLGPFSCHRRDPYASCWGDPRRGLHQLHHPTDPTRPFREMTKTSVWALNSREPRIRPGGVHWRVAYPDYPKGEGHVPPRDLGGDHPELQDMGLHEARRRFFGFVPISVYVANVRPIQDGHHPWPGISPFPLYEPGQFRAACSDGVGTAADLPAPREDDFNQPSVWVALNKDRVALSSAGDPADSVAPPALRLDSGRLHLDSRLAREGSVHAQGLNAFARAQAYYHRPGDWAEHPNFMNPFWRARLAATLQGRGLVAPLRVWLEALPPRLREQPERVLTH
jgi:hypothetical protein